MMKGEIVTVWFILLIIVGLMYMLVCSSGDKEEREKDDRAQMEYLREYEERAQQKKQQK